MKLIREEKADSDVGDGFAQAIHRHLYIYAQRFHDIGAAARTGGRSVAMLCNADACSCNDERGGCGDVECAGPVAAGAAGIEDGEGVAIPESFGFFSQYLCEGHQFGSFLTFHPKCSQKPGHLCIARCSRHELFHRCTCFRVVKIHTIDELWDGIGNHERSMKLASSCLPTTVMIDSG